MPDSGKKGRPCDQCRRRKSRCVVEDGKTSCILCIFHSQQCQYDEAPAPRKRRSSHHGPSPSSTSESKRSRVITTMPGTGVEEYDTLPGPSLLKKTLGLQNLHHSQYLGPNAIPDVASLSPSESINPGRKTLVEVRYVHPSHAFHIISDASTADYERETRLIDEIEATVGPYGKDLVQLYFRIIHPAFPILHREVFLEKYARSYREFSPPLLATVYLLSCGYWSFSEALAGMPKPDPSKLRNLALQSLQYSLQRPKLSTIQAALLLSQYSSHESIDITESVRSQMTVRLVDLAYGLGLHLDASAWQIPDWEKGLRRRLAWAVVIQDKWTSLFSGRPSLVRLEEWAIQPLDPEDFPENIENEEEGSSEVEKGRIVFTEMAVLSSILSDIITHVFSARALKALETADGKLNLLLDTIKPLQIRLKEWFTHLPDSLKMDTAASMKLSPVGYLRLAYLTVETCLHRQIAKVIESSAGLDPGLLFVCFNAAQERFLNSVDFLQRLQAQHLTSFWYFTSARCCAMICVFGKVLIRIAPGDGKKNELAQKLKEIRWALKVNSEAGATFMKHALTLLHISPRVITTEEASQPVMSSPTGQSTVVSKQNVNGGQEHSNPNALPSATATFEDYNLLNDVGLYSFNDSDQFDFSFDVNDVWQHDLTTGGRTG